MTSREVCGVLDTVNFENALVGADLVITGEGSLDRQSLCGKVVTGVARRAALCGVPVVALVRDVGEGADEIHALGVTAAFPSTGWRFPMSRRGLEAAGICTPPQGIFCGGAALLKFRGGCDTIDKSFTADKPLIT